MNSTTGINSSRVSRWNNVVGMGTSPSSMSRLIRSITSSGGAGAGFVDSLEPKGCPAKSDVMRSVLHSSQLISKIIILLMCIAQFSM
jgi:hypothetical protein